ncbi:unnamed protein product, partial [Mesorhabditis spiculigera]
MLRASLFALLFIATTTSGQNDGQRFQSMLKGFFKLSANYPLTPAWRSNYNQRSVIYRMKDRTEYSANHKILNDVFESDMVLTPYQMEDVIDTFRARVEGRPKRVKRNAAAVNEKLRWPNRTIPFEFKDRKDGKWVTLLMSGMEKWSRETCIKFVPHSNERDFVTFFRGGGCYSNVGRTGGKQYISIGFGCDGSGIVAHELGHAIGFWHEQSRPDRDEYINLNNDNIIKGTYGNFEKRTDLDTADVPYDFGSVMHYGPQAFTNNWNYVTIETKDHRFQHTIGQRADISFIDVKHANRLYCSGICQVNLHCLNGGYEDPLNCQTCKCPPGLGGQRCGHVAVSTAGCGGELIAGATWNLLTSRQIGTCHWRILAPLGQKIRFEIIEAKYKCDSSCAENYLEIKHQRDMQQTGFRQCCNAAPGVIVSEGNQVIITSVAKDKQPNFSIRYILEQAYLPKPPVANWEGQGGLTGLLGQEAGIDNTFENYLVKELPTVLRATGPRADIGSFFNLVDSLLRAGSGKKK